MIFYEKHNFGEKDLYRNISIVNILYPAHFHTSFEFIFVTEGQIEVFLEGKNLVLDKNNAVLIFPNQIHSLRTVDFSNIRIIIFSPELIGHFSHALKGKLPVKNDFYFGNFNFEEYDDNIYLIRGLLYTICGKFFSQVQFYEKNSINNKLSLIHEMLAYVEENYQNKCNLSELALVLKYDYSYLSKIFIRNTNMKFNEYVNHYRISRACYQIIHSNDSISKIAFDSGYESIRTFNRNFLKIMKVTPAEYKKCN